MTATSPKSDTRLETRPGIQPSLQHRPVHRHAGRLLRRQSVVLAFIVLLAAVGSAQTPDSLFKGFERTGDYVLEIDGELDAKAEVYYQRRIPAFLVLPGDATTPLLLVPRTKAVQAVNIMKIAKQTNGSLDLLSDAAFAQKGVFEIDGTSIVFAMDGRKMRLGDKPPLLGLHPASGLEDYSPSYARLSESYKPDARAISALTEDSRDVHLRVYFGSWCPFCQRYVPRMMRVADEVAGSNVKIDFYGLPQAMSSDPVAQQMNLKGVPTGVVFVDGREKGRLETEDWKEPEKALRRLLGR